MILNRLANICIAGIVCFIVSLASAQAVTVTILAGTGVAGFNDGPGASATFKLPRRVAADGAGNVYVADYANSRIRKIDAAGNVTTLAGSGVVGYLDGPATMAKFSSPMGIAVDRAGNIFVADMGNKRIRKIDAAGNVTTVAGNGMTGYADGPGATAMFNLPHGLAVDDAGNLYVADTGNHRIRKIDTAGNVTTLAGDGTATYTLLSIPSPRGIAVDGAGNVFVAETYRIRKIDAAGNVTTLAGGNSYSANGVGAAAGFNNAWDVAVDDAGNIFVADLGNSKIRKIDPITGYVSTLTTVQSPMGGTVSPIGVAVDGRGNLIVTSESSNFISKVNYQTSLPLQPISSSQTISFDAMPAIAVGGANTLSATGGGDRQPDCFY